DRFDLEFFGVTLTTHGTSYLGLIMRLGGVYETRGDSIIILYHNHFSSFLFVTASLLRVAQIINSTSQGIIVWYPASRYCHTFACPNATIRRIRINPPDGFTLYDSKPI
ncbi:hypothetical protein LD001_06250, partial [Pseudomonas kurunegalensis]|uniref:hypothetical protein n=1 Tax=Pseudomonas kurunegalensis TaxID=485880 RepID=UPI001CDD51DC